MTRLLIIAIALGAIGGFVRSLRVYFAPPIDNSNWPIVFHAATLFFFTAVSTICVCVVLGVTEKSRSLFSGGILGGIASALVYVVIRILFNPSAVISALILMVMLGLVGASIVLYRRSVSKRKIYVCVAGVAGGILSVVASMAVLYLTAVVGAALTFIYSNAPDEFMLNILNPSLQGAFQAAVIWLCIVLADSSFGSV